MKKKILLSMLSMLTTVLVIAQENNNNAIHQNVNEKESILNGKKIRERTVDIIITGKYNQDTYDYTFKPKKFNELSVLLESNNSKVAFEVLKDNKNISGKDLLKSWKKEDSNAAAITIRVFLPKHLKDPVSFKLRILATGY